MTSFLVERVRGQDSSFRLGVALHVEGDASADLGKKGGEARPDTRRAPRFYCVLIWQNDKPL